MGPTLFLPDEFAALGCLGAVERAMGLMVGCGLQLQPVLQGETASRKRSGGAFRCRTGGALGQLRDLLTPDEIIQFAAHLRLLRVRGRPPAIAPTKLRYYADPEFQGLYAPGAA